MGSIRIVQGPESGHLVVEFLDSGDLAELVSWLAGAEAEVPFSLCWGDHVIPFRGVASVRFFGIAIKHTLRHVQRKEEKADE